MELGQAEIGLMEDVERFLGKDLGKWFMNRIDSLMDEAVENFKKVDPDDAKAVRNAQFEMWRPEQLKIWFNELLLQGQMILSQREMEDD